MSQTSKNIAFLFAGQGAVPETPLVEFMGTSVETTYNKFASPDTPPLKTFCQSTTTSDESAQLGVFDLTLAMAHEALDHCTPDIITGYSSGLYAAMVTSGGLKHTQGHEAIKLAYRGVKQQRKGSIMVGVIGISFSDIGNILKKISPTGQLSLVNNKSQVIVSILKDELPLLKAQCHDAGALNIIPLPFAYPYHVSELSQTGDALQHYFESLQLPPLLIPMVAGSTPEYIKQDSNKVAALVASQLHQTVWWYKTIHCLIEQGATTFVVFDPTDTLTRIIRWISRSIKTVGIRDMDDFNQLKGL